MVSVLTKSREKQFLGNGKNGHCDLEKSMKIKKKLFDHVHEQINVKDEPLLQI